MNKELFKDSRLDFFILWANGYIHEEEILSEINKNFKIIRIKRHKPFIFFYDVLKIYKYSFIPIYFLFKKLFYLKNYQKEFTAIEVINDKPNLVHNFNGIFRSYHCARIQNLKENIRYNFGHPKSEEHVVHSTDSFHDYLAIKNLIGEKNRIVSDYLEESFINIEDLYCIQSFGNRHNYKEKIIPLKDSVHFQYLKGRKEDYINYMNNFRGTSIQKYHSTKVFNDLFDSIRKEGHAFHSIKVKFINQQTVILDGLHRASIYLHLNKKRIKALIYE